MPMPLSGAAANDSCLFVKVWRISIRQRGNGPSVVMRGLVARISLRLARRCLLYRDGRDKPGHDKKGTRHDKKGDQADRQVLQGQSPASPSDGFLRLAKDLRGVRGKSYQ